jgi:hypothetical protein
LYQVRKCAPAGLIRAIGGMLFATVLGSLPPPAGAEQPAAAGSVRLTRAFGALRLGMTINQARRALPGIKEDFVLGYDPAVMACIKAGCSDLLTYSYANETGTSETGEPEAILVFFRGRLSSFEWDEDDDARQAAVEDRWKKDYGPPQKTEPNASLGGGDWLEWQDQHTRLSFDKHAAGLGLRLMIDDLTTEREMREEAERQQQQSSPLTLVAETYGFPSYGAYRTATDKIARLNNGQELTEEQALNLSLQLAAGRALPAGTKVAQQEEKGSAATKVLNWALKVRVLNGTDVGEELWIPAFADLKDCSVPLVNSEWPQFCNGE